MRKRAKPVDLPVEPPVGFEPIINHKAAKALGSATLLSHLLQTEGVT
jgi:hypothetical protein